MTDEEIQALQALAKSKADAWESARDACHPEELWDAGDDIADIAGKVPSLCAELLAARAELTAIANEVDVPLPDGVEPTIVNAIRALHEQVASVNLQASQARAENVALRERVADLKAALKPFIFANNAVKGEK